MCGCITAFSRVSLAGMLSFLLLSIFFWYYRKMRRKEEHLRVCLIPYCFFFLSSRSKKEKDAIKVKGKQKKKAAHIGVLPSHTSIQKKKKKLEK